MKMNSRCMSSTLVLTWHTKQMTEMTVDVKMDAVDVTSSRRRKWIGRRNPCVAVCIEAQWSPKKKEPHSGGYRRWLLSDSVVTIYSPYGENEIFPLKRFVLHVQVVNSIKISSWAFSRRIA